MQPTLTGDPTTAIGGILGIAIALIAFVLYLGVSALFIVLAGKFAYRMEIEYPQALLAAFVNVLILGLFNCCLGLSLGLEPQSGTGCIGWVVALVISGFVYGSVIKDASVPIGWGKGFVIALVQSLLALLICGGLALLAAVATGVMGTVFGN